MRGIVIRNPATGDESVEEATTIPGDVPGLVGLLRATQPAWAALPLRRRLDFLAALERELAGHAETLVRSIVVEIGKPRAEAVIEVATTLDAIRWTRRHAASVLRERREGPGLQRLLLMGTARVSMRAHGVVGLIGTWNYPLLLNLAPIAQALVAGNAVVWKPSEHATNLGILTRMLLRESLARIGGPDPVATILGGPDVGAALVGSGVDHVVFTGGIPAGRAVLEKAGALGISATAELSGFDPAIVLPDAPVEATASALAWGAFVGAGQTCVAIKRVYVVGDAGPWADALARNARALRVGDPSAGEVDVGPLISPAARDRVHATVVAAVAAGARVAAGGRPIEGPGSFYEPTVLVADTADPEAALAGIFGPVVIVRGMPDAESAIAAANAGPFGLAASVWGRDRRRLRVIADRLDAGMVTINDAVTSAGHAAAPFGGVKASGHGRTRGEHGLLAFVQPKAVHERGPGGLRPQLYPYTGRIEGLIRAYMRFVHRTPR
jgi:acyl-CoA reductase-like NAD-dependent aldehyde dehydrogenase